jgi:tRNA modification GTPase
MSPRPDTIYALSSGRPPAAIAVVRISGPRAGDALKALTGRLPAPRMAALARVRDPISGEMIDEALALWFPGPRSETGEDAAELQLHGGRAVVAATLAALSGLEGLRLAEPGEFTRRAFENGRLDLTAVEGLADLIYAETEAQRRQAYRQMKGLLGDRAEIWRAQMIEALALVEARIDFSDETDVPENLLTPALEIARRLRDEIAEALAGAVRGERLRDGLVVAIAGPPNVGKSTLLNRIARREAAIVSPQAGTTRDVIEVHLDLDGYPVTLLDTAGIRDSADPIEQEGVRRARAGAAAADLVLWVVDGSQIAGGQGRDPVVGGGADGSSPNLSELGAATTAERTWRVVNKIDKIDSLVTNMMDNIDECEFKHHGIELFVSALSGKGMNNLLKQVTLFVTNYFGSEPALVSRERQRRLLHDAHAALERSLSPKLQEDEDLIAEELQQASQSLGRLLGRVDVEEVLDVIFRDFCIGK